MVDDGYGDVVNIDISSVVIDAMNKKYSHRPQLKCASLSLSVYYIPIRGGSCGLLCVLMIMWKNKKTDLKMDVRDMKAFQDASFDAVIDKGNLSFIKCLTLCFMQ